VSWAVVLALLAAHAREGVAQSDCTDKYGPGCIQVTAAARGACLQPHHIPSSTWCCSNSGSCTKSRGHSPHPISAVFLTVFQLGLVLLQPYHAVEPISHFNPSRPAHVRATTQCCGPPPPFPSTLLCSAPTSPSHVIGARQAAATMMAKGAPAGQGRLGGLEGSWLEARRWPMRPPVGPHRTRLHSELHTPGVHAV
jgi:hypothetical protein